MINKIANRIGEVLAEPVANSNKYKDIYTREEIKQIITYDITGKLKQAIWILVLALISYIAFIIDIDIRLTTFIAFIIIIVFRNNFGGYHANSEKICLIISTIIPLAIGYISIILNLNILIIAAIYIFAYITAFIKKVVDHPNRRFEEGNKILNMEMKERLFKTGVTILIIISIVQVIVYLKGYKDISNSMVLATFTSFVNLYFGK